MGQSPAGRSREPGVHGKVDVATLQSCFDTKDIPRGIKKTAIPIFHVIHPQSGSAQAGSVLWGGVQRGYSEDGGKGEGVRVL